MPIDSKLDNDRNLTILTADGEQTFEDVFEAIKGIQTRDILLVFVNAGISALTSDEMDTLSRSAIRQAERRRGGRTALVALDDGDFKTATLFKALTSSAPRTLKVFRKMDEAERWLKK